MLRMHMEYRFCYDLLFVFQGRNLIFQFGVGFHVQTLRVFAVSDLFEGRRV